MTIEGTGDPVSRIHALIKAGRYRVRLHAVRHMISEGFDEWHLVQALQGRLRMIEEYPEDSRYLVLGRFRLTPKTVCSLHAVCDLSGAEVLDIVTAYLPQRPWWVSQTRRGKRK